MNTYVPKQHAQVCVDGKYVCRNTGLFEQHTHMYMESICICIKQHQRSSNTKRKQDLESNDYTGSRDLNVHPKKGETAGDCDPETGLLLLGTPVTPAHEQRTHAHLSRFTGSQVWLQVKED